MIEILIRTLGVALGAAIVLRTLSSAVRTVVVPRGEMIVLQGLVLLSARRVVQPLAYRRDTVAERERILSRYAPASLLALAGLWGVLVVIGYTFVFRSTTADTWVEALVYSGSSLTTLGIAAPAGAVGRLIAVTEGFLGLGLVGLLISFLPSMYSAYSAREFTVARLDTPAGTPHDQVEMLRRITTIDGWDRLDDIFDEWDRWYTSVAESHTSFIALCYFRSQDERCWVTSGGVVLDVAALTLSAVDRPWSANAAMCVRSGMLGLRQIAGLFGVPFDPDPSPDDPISIGRAEFDAALDDLAAHGVPLRADREQAWRDFAGWRVNYDSVLLGLTGIVMAPEGVRWSSDRVEPVSPKVISRIVMILRMRRTERRSGRRAGRHAAGSSVPAR